MTIEQQPLSAHAQVMAIAAAAASLISAHQAGLLVALLERPGSAAELAERLSLDPTATARVLDVLSSIELVEQRNASYTASSLLQHSVMGPAPGLDHLYAVWEQLPQFLATGHRRAFRDDSAEARNAVYSQVVAGLARVFTPVAEQLATALTSEPPRRVLDVGAGSGVWSLAMAQKNPTTHVTALDLPDVLERFRERASALALADRIDTIAGDYQSVEVPPGAFDRIVIANVLHLEPPAACRTLLGRVVEWLARDGEVVIVDAMSPASADARRFHAAYALHLALRTEHGYPHDEADLRSWLIAAGVPNIERIELSAAMAFGALVARRA